MKRFVAGLAGLGLVVGVAWWAWPMRAPAPPVAMPAAAPPVETRPAEGSASASSAPPVPVDPPVLSSEARKYLWETENVAFEVSYKTGPALGQAIVDRNPAKLAAFFTPDFRGATLSPDAGEAMRLPFAEWRTCKKGKEASTTVDGAGMAAWLTKLAERFHSSPQVQLSVLTVAPERRDKLDGPWRSTWQLRFAGERADRPPGKLTSSFRMRADEMFPAPFRASGGAPLEIVLRLAARWQQAPSDFGEGRGWLRSLEVEQLTSSTAERTLMEDVTAASGIDTRGMIDNWTRKDGAFSVSPGGIYAADVNGDGWIDLLITDETGPVLYINERGKFVDRTLAWGLPLTLADNRLAAFADLDNDGRVDLVLGKSVYQNTGKGFQRRAALALANPTAAGFAVADYDRDGKLDLYVTYPAPSPHEQKPGVARRVSWVDDNSGPGNQLLRNVGDFRFEDVTEKANAAAGHMSSFTAAWLDADDDGWPDLYVINELGNNLLLMNQRNGAFAPRKVGPAHDGFAMGLAAGDFDEDGRTDLYLGNMKSKMGQRIVANLPADAYTPDIRDRMRRWVGGNILLTNDGQGGFAERLVGADGSGWTYGPQAIDFDGDGRLDLISTCGFVSKSRREPDG